MCINQRYHDIVSIDNLNPLGEVDIELTNVVIEYKSGGHWEGDINVRDSMAKYHNVRVNYSQKPIVYFASDIRMDENVGQSRADLLRSLDVTPIGKRHYIPTGRDTGHYVGMSIDQFAQNVLTLPF